MTRFCHYADVLGAEANARIYDLAVTDRGRFERSRTVHRGVDPEHRVSSVLYDDRLTDVAGLLREQVMERLGAALARLGIPAFEPGLFEIQMTSHNDGEFFRRHTDSASASTASRALTFVYYFHRVPTQYAGGELVFCDEGAEGGGDVVISPDNDSLVLFDPRTPHEVRPIRCPSGRFEDGRFTLNGWLHHRSGGAGRDSFFDAKILTPIGRWASDRGPGQRPAVEPVPSAPTAASAPAPTAVRGTGPLAGLLLLYGDLHRTGSAPDVVDVRPGLSGAAFFDDYYARNRPVLLPGALQDSPAVGTWSPPWLAERHGNVEVEITSGRDASPDYERRYRELTRRVTLAELAEMLAGGAESNDFYLVARNHFFDNPQLRHLRESLRPPEDIIDAADRTPGSAKLWIGPRGTVTPLHFDEHSILFTQVYGRKHVKLIPSFDYPRLYVRDTYYSEVDPERPDPSRHPLFLPASVHDVVVGPGDALFLPAGWWHWARSLAVSISATFSSFARPWRNTPLGGH